MAGNSLSPTNPGLHGCQFIITPIGDFVVAPCKPPTYAHRSNAEAESPCTLLRSCSQAMTPNVGDPEY